MNLSQIIRPVLLGTLMKITACAPGGGSWVGDSQLSAAQDQIMWVRQEPPTFGFRRLTTQSAIYPDLAFFVSSHGLPNFMAETGNQERRYFILYYLSDREAFACRTLSGNRKAVEFAGPYPITDGEFKLLDGVRKGRTVANAGS